jgi:hypothetical protein
MALEVKIGDGEGDGVHAHVHPFIGLQHKHNGLLTLQERFLQFNPEVRPFVNPTFGTALNQDVAFSGTPEIIHNGGTSVEWDALPVQGTWNFADSGKISLTGANNGDAAMFSEENPATIDMSGYTALTGKINLTIYDAAVNALVLEFDLADVVVGNSVALNDYINTGLVGTEQSFVIPKADLGLASQNIDGFTITLLRTGGIKPTMTFDDIQLEQTGEPAVFKMEVGAGTRFHISELRLGIADALTTTYPDAEAVRPTLPDLAYDQILGVGALSNGIVFRRVQAGKTLFSVVLKQLSDFLSIGSDLVTTISDGTNTYITLLVTFPEPIVLVGSEADDFLSFAINDDLSGLLLFNVSARGAVERDIS